MTGTHAAHAATLRDYLNVVRRRGWAIIVALAIVPTVAVALSLRQPPLYQAQAEVLLSMQNLADALTGTASSGVSMSPDRIAQTQAEIARVPAVAQRTLNRITDSGLSVGGFLGSSSVVPSASTDFLTFTVTNGDPLLARRLVDAYARQYTLYRRTLDSAAIVAALDKVNARLADLARTGGRHSSLYTSLIDRRETLATMDALQTSNASVVTTASSALQVAPRPLRNGLFGLGLALILGVGLAFIWEALDTRVRHGHEIGERLGLPLLARVPSPPKRRTGPVLAMLEEPSGVLAEAFRMLRTNLGFVTLGRGIRTIMVTSAVEQEGKSTTIANLAVALARAGQRVVLVDLDLRRPFLHTLFSLDGPGVTQVALGEARLESALQSVPITDPEPKRSRFGRGQKEEVEKPVRAVLDVLPTGPIPPDPGEFIGTVALSEILAYLRENYDVVLVDAPPALHVGDAMTLSTKVDGILVVARAKVVRRQFLTELARQLATSPTPVLGYIVTGAEEEADYREGYGYYGYEATAGTHAEVARSRGGS